ncbi:hypothetical protein BX616_004005, partial [Lobosporangium transversale]
MTRKFFTATVAISLMVLASSWLQTTNAIMFDLHAQTPSDAVPFCISHYVDEETQVVVKVKASSGPHQKISVE